MIERFQNGEGEDAFLASVVWLVFTLENGEVPRSMRDKYWNRILVTINEAQYRNAKHGSSA